MAIILLFLCLLHLSRYIEPDHSCNYYQIMAIKKPQFDPAIAPPIVAVVGRNNLGKQVLPNYLRDHYPSITAIEMGAFARQLAEEAKKNSTQPYDTSGQNLARHGAEHFIPQLIQAISQSAEWRNTPLIIIGIQTPAEAAMLKAYLGSRLLLASIETHDQETPQSPAPAKRMQVESKDAAQPKTAEFADVILGNGGSLENFYRQIEAKVVPHLLNKN